MAPGRCIDRGAAIMVTSWGLLVLCAVGAVGAEPGRAATIEANEDGDIMVRGSLDKKGRRTLRHLAFLSFISTAQVHTYALLGTLARSRATASLRPECRLEENLEFFQTRATRGTGRIIGAVIASR